MKGTDLLYQGQAVTLEEMLQARDKRAARQRQALNCYRLPLISLTLVAPGAVKNSAVWRRVADYAIAEILALCEQKEWVNVWEMQVNERSGPEWMAAVCALSNGVETAHVDTRDEPSVRAALGHRHY